MNPFDLNGPQFLWFYGVLGAVSYIFLRVYVTYRERQHPIPKLKMSDPFKIAFLRGNKNETIRIASLSLIDRGLLEVFNPSSSTPTLATANPYDINVGKTRIERALLRLFCARQEARAAFKDEDCKSACSEYSNELGDHRLVRTKEIIQERLVPIVPVALLLLGVSVIKIVVALDRGRTNVAFLVILTGLLMYFFVRLILRHRTGLGDRVISDLKTLFHSLYVRRDSLRRRQTSDAALLAAVFGISALPAAFQFARDIFRKAAEKGGCGSSCGSTGCGSGSGGCGGGCGSGGGCGGCGS